MDRSQHQAVVFRLANVVEQAGRILSLINAGDIPISDEQAKDALAHVAVADSALHRVRVDIDPLLD